MPCLDEASTLQETLPAALALADEVVVSDGGSADGSATVAEALGARVVVGPAGRGRQLRAGADLARGDVLLFLHADTFLPGDVRSQVQRALTEGAEGGGFLVRFDDDRPRLRLAAWLINRRTRLLRTPLGDQAQFVSRQVYEELGGYRDWPILEDLDFARRLKRRGRLTVLSGPVTTSARRFIAQGSLRTIVVNWLIWLLYLCGMPPRKLARLYGKIR